MTNDRLEEVYLRWQEAYFHWLVPQVQEEDRSTRTYWDLYRVMFQKEFVFMSHTPLDDDRIADGLELRTEFLLNADAPRFLSPDGFGVCSFLEMLVALSRRLAWAAGGEAPGWAWQLVVNMELNKLSDPMGPRKKERAEEILDRVIWRNYAPDGTGGMFPLAWPEQNQKEVEIWYQMAAYIAEMHPEY